MVVIGGNSLVWVSCCVVILHDPFSSQVVIVFVSVVSTMLVSVFVVTIQILSSSQIVVMLTIGEDVMTWLLTLEEREV